MSSLLAWLAAIMLTAAPAPAAAASDTILAPLRERVRALIPLVSSDLARQFLAASAALPPPPQRTIYRDPSTGAWLSAAAADTQPGHVRARLEPRVFSGLDYYNTRYGPFLSYFRVIDILGIHGVTSFEGKRVLDFGYGRVGHLRAIASLGASVVGVDVDPELRALYASPGDQGMVPELGARAGSVTLVDGRFPGQPATRAAVGAAFDLVISKNTLKGGHTPEQRARQAAVVDLGVPDSVFVRAMFEILKPDGVLILYTVAGPQGGGQCPFPESMLRSAGFTIVAYDRDDSRGAQAMLEALHGRENLSVPLEELTGTYTLARKPRGRRGELSPAGP